MSSPERVLSLSSRLSFLKETNLPIPVAKSPYFEYFLNLYEPLTGSATLYKAYRESIFSLGSQSEFQQTQKAVRNKLIAHVTSQTTLFEKLSSSDYLSQAYPLLDSIYSRRSRDSRLKIGKVYSGANVGQGRKFVSVDLVKANYQSLRMLGFCRATSESEEGGVLKTYEDFVRYVVFGAQAQRDGVDRLPVHLRSKQMRQYVFGHCCPKGQTHVVKFLIQKVLLALVPELDSRETEAEGESSHSQRPDILASVIRSSTLRAISNDELVFDISELADSEVGAFETELTRFVEMNLPDIQLHVELFRLECVKSPKRGDKIMSYVKVPFLVEDPDAAEEGLFAKRRSLMSRTIFKTCPVHYFAQVFKHYYGMEVGKNDMVFKFESFVARFEETLF